ncbi:MAG: hypothetical protein PVF74_00430 [Anaerolineales bacterium]|jgi:uncharacterized BrkB/YihY/UPF0761 family membrane protein
MVTKLIKTSFIIIINRISSAFGVAGAVAVILIGIDTLAQIFLFGAVFTRV